MSNHFNPKLIKTADDTHTVYMEQLNEYYHSNDGALTESIHVYIQNGWKILRNKSHVELLEVGFGTGLNALLTCEQAIKENVLVHYHCLEPFPLPQDLAHSLDFSYLTDNPVFQTILKKMHESPFDIDVQIHPLFTFRKYFNTIQNANWPLSSFDLIYYDAFAPRKQPEMWTKELLEKTLQLLKKEGVFVTYCANGEFKRNLKSLGFEPENPKGYGRRKEITRVVKG
jgi:tRNA U34 5-methylaminomethyl-2-thiouridine-forming methyltransferase MnmC